MNQQQMNHSTVYATVLHNIDSFIPDFKLQLTKLYESFSETKFRIAFSRLRRELTDSIPDHKNSEVHLEFTKKEIDTLTQSGFPSAARRPLHIHARVVYLLHAAEQLGPKEAPRFIHELFTRSDTPEQCSILCALPLFSNPQDYCDTAVLSTRGYIREVYDTIALQNPYPARYFPDSVFNQMVLKAFFMEAPLSEIVDLQERVNDDLRRMAEDFVKERSAANRSVPNEINLIL
ncbi:MAG: EboA domain-containing protein [Leptospirales bacterium]